MRTKVHIYLDLGLVAKLISMECGAELLKAANIDSLRSIIPARRLLFIICIININKLTNSYIQINNIIIIPTLCANRYRVNYSAELRHTPNLGALVLVVAAASAALSDLPKVDISYRNEIREWIEQ